MSILHDPNRLDIKNAHPSFQAHTVETAHLTLRSFDEIDIDALYAIMRDTVAMRYTYKAPSREHCAARLHAYAEEAVTLGYAPWTITLRDGGHVIGWGGLNIDPLDPDWGPEVAYCLHPAHWGRGYGTELVAASLELGFARVGLETIAAFVHPENIGSARVLVKNGFQRLRYLSTMERDYYAVDRAGWEIARPKA